MQQRMLRSRDLTGCGVRLYELPCHYLEKRGDNHDTYIRVRVARTDSNWVHLEH
jgi:hypothetical protein